MNILFITLIDIRSVYEHNIYTDLVREFALNNHIIYIASPVERRCGQTTHLVEDNTDNLAEHVHILKIRTGNIQKTSLIEKGISVIRLESQLLKGIKKHFKNIHFDLMLYSTPPITILKPLQFIKKRDNAKTYLMLKDIFPQNAVDIGMMSKFGIKGLIYNFFRKKELKLYGLSDKIGCMSQANVDYVLKHNTEVAIEKVEICPNGIEVQDVSEIFERRVAIRKKYGIPTDKKVFLYGGNLGRPQGIPFIIECLKTIKDPQAYFLIVGNGTEYGKLETFMNVEKPANVKLMKLLPKDDFDRIAVACDIGLIFLDHRFSIPNFPSRLLTYLQAGLPILAVTDPNTDIGKIIVDGGFGWWCESNNAQAFKNSVDQCLKLKTTVFAENGHRYLNENYTVRHVYEKIMNAVDEMDRRNTNKHEWHIVSSNRILCSLGNKILSYRAGVLYIQEGLEGNPTKLLDLPGSTSKRILAKNRLFERAMRLEPRIAIPLSANEFLLSFQGKIYNVNISSKNIHVEHSYRPGMNNTLSFCIADNRILYGEYFRNGHHEAVCLYERIDNEVWTKRYEFTAGEIIHIHQIVFDKYRECFWILTGDTDGESGIWKADPEFSSVVPIFKGKQKYRSDFLVPSESGIIYATDTPLEINAIYYSEPDNQGNWKEPIKIFEMPGPCIYGKEISGGRYALATSVEPDSSLPTVQYRLTNKLGAGVKDRFCHIIVGNSTEGFREVASFKKDFLNMWLFQFGNVQFPNTSTDYGLLCTGQSLQQIDEKTIRINI